MSREPERELEGTAEGRGWKEGDNGGEVVESDF